MDGVALLVGLDDEGAVGVEVQALDLRQQRVAVGEVHRELIGLQSLRLQQTAVGLGLGEGQQRDLVGQEVGIGHFPEGIDVERVAPDGIRPRVRLRRRLEGLVAEGEHLTLLTEAEVAVHILQSVGPIGAWGDTLHHEVAAAVCPRHTQQGLGLEGGVGQIVVESHEDALDWLQVAGIEHIARHLERVDPLTCGEGEGIVAHRITLVVVADGIAEVHGIGCVLLQRVLQFHHDLLACALDLRHLQLRGRDDDLVGGILYLDELIEVDGDLLGLHVGSPVLRCTADDFWRVVVVPTAIGLAHAGTTENKRGQEDKKTGKQDLTPVMHIRPPRTIVLSSRLLVFLSSHFLFIHYAFSFNNCSNVSRLLLRRGTLCCPPNLPRNFSQSLNRFCRATMISRCCSVMSL